MDAIEEFNMKKTEIKWQKGIMMVCTACQKKTLNGVELKLEGNAGENLKSYLKNEMIQLGHGKTIRVITSSCLDVCEKGAQAVSYCPVDGKTEVYTLHPEMDKDSLLEFLKNKL